jgi:phage repressor protein C with HTH and peptisase S24 domain
MTTTREGCSFKAMKNIGERIEKAREIARLNQSELARQMGVSPQAVQKWEAGETVPRGQRIEHLAAVLGVSVSYLMSDDGTGGIRLVSDNSELPAIGKTVVVPRLNVSGSMGYGLAKSDGYMDIIERMTVSAEWIRQTLSVTSPNNLAIITGRGDSMEGTYDDGDLLLVDRGISDLQIDAVYVLSIDGELYIKRVQRQPGGIIIMISDNPKYQPITLKPADMESFEVLGRVMLAWNARKM